MRNPMTLSLGRWFVSAIAVACAAAAAQAKPRITIEHHKPCNIFLVDDAIRYRVEMAGLPAGQAKVAADVTNYFGEKVWSTSQPVEVKPGERPSLTLEIGKLECGYYELRITVSAAADGKALGESDLFSFGVTRRVERTAEEVRKGGYRFGLKTFQIGTPGVWWRRPLVWDLAEVVDATTKLGLQWTRHQFNQSPNPEQPGIISTQDLLIKHPMNAVLKIEGFPEACFDEARYGPREEWVKKHNPHWSRWTVPNKEPYQKWLREELAKIPPEQNVFEIGNEPWGRISPEEWAEYCQMIVAVVREVRPGAAIGTNTGQGPSAWEIRFIQAGGMKGMNMASIHPYSFTPLPERRTRVAVRNYRDFLRARIGRDLDVHVTEYGWPTAPKDRRKHSVSERVQAQRTARQSLMLYAEDCKTLIPHWMGDREHDLTDREHWFGFFRLNGQPKPVVMAHAACAARIDGGRFVGDLWYGPGVGAMLFERGGVYTLALWTLEEEPGKGTDLTVDVATRQVTVADLMGREKAVPTDGGKLRLKVNSDVTYLVGVGEALAKQAVGPEGELNTERWTPRDGSFAMKRAKTPPKIDGKLDDWTDAKAIELRGGGGPTGAQTYFAWDAENLYLAVSVRDQELTAAPADKKLNGGDLFVASLGARPSRQLSLGGWGLYDYELRIAPTSAEGTPALSMTNVNWDKPLVNPPADDPSGLRWAVATTPDGWSAEAAIPIKLLNGYPRAAAGEKISCYLQVLDQDKPPSPRVRLTATPSTETLKWPYVVLEE
ncbi:MAG TPA: hypothetical protein PK082_03865 [Phycisphaerae bacterium]|nr:hypothetical protein [Phycisphaerae bacterium]